jgi:hypothetical protein
VTVVVVAVAVAAEEAASCDGCRPPEDLVCAGGGSSFAVVGVATVAATGARAAGAVPPRHAPGRLAQAMSGCSAARRYGAAARAAGPAAARAVWRYSTGAQDTARETPTTTSAGSELPLLLLSTVPLSSTTADIVRFLRPPDKETVVNLS